MQTEYTAILLGVYTVSQSYGFHSLDEVCEWFKKFPKSLSTMYSVMEVYCNGALLHTVRLTA